MSSAVQAMLDGGAPSGRHGVRSAYRAMCMCCAPPSEPDKRNVGKPQRKTNDRPVLAWRERLLAKSALLQGNDVRVE